MAFFRKRRREEFIFTEAGSLANYMKNNAVKFGGEVYAKFAALRILPQEIDESLLWYFWVLVFGFRVARDMGPIKETYKKDVYEELFHALSQIDKKHFAKINHAPYEDTFDLVGRAADFIYHSEIEDPKKQTAAFFLQAVKEIPYVISKENKFMIVESLIRAVDAFPSLSEVIAREA